MPLGTAFTSHVEGWGLNTVPARDPSASLLLAPSGTKRSGADARDWCFRAAGWDSGCCRGRSGHWRPWNSPVSVRLPSLRWHSHPLPVGTGLPRWECGQPWRGQSRPGLRLGRGCRRSPDSSRAEDALGRVPRTLRQAGLRDTRPQTPAHYLATFLSLDLVRPRLTIAGSSFLWQ